MSSKLTFDSPVFANHSHLWGACQGQMKRIQASAPGKRRCAPLLVEHLPAEQACPTLGAASAAIRCRRSAEWLGRALVYGSRGRPWRCACSRIKHRRARGHEGTQRQPHGKLMILRALVPSNERLAACLAGASGIRARAVAAEAAPTGCLGVLPEPSRLKALPHTRPQAQSQLSVRIAGLKSPR